MPRDSAAEHLDLLLDRGHCAALRAALRLRLSQHALQLGHLQRVRGQLGGDAFADALGGLDLAAEPRVLGDGLALAAAPGRALRLEVGALANQPLAAGGDVADALLEPAHLERRLRERALRRVQRVVRFVVRLADRFELGLGAAQVGALGLERGDGGDHGRPTRSSSRAASRWRRNQSWCSFSCASCCRAR